jgi:hypothetical protein
MARGQDWSRVGVGVAAGAVLLAVGYALLRRKPAPSPSPLPGVQFSGISGEVAVPYGGALPTLTTVLTNHSSVAETYTLTCTSGSIVWQTSTPTVTVPPAGSVTVHWNATYSAADGPGPFVPILVVEASGMATQTFMDSSQFSVTVIAAAPAAQLSFSGGPSGTETANQGANLSLPSLTTVLTNSGNASGTFTISVTSTQTATGSGEAPSSPATIAWTATQDSVSGTYSAPTASPSVRLSAGASVNITWTATITDVQPAEAGTYRTEATVTVQ